MSFHHALIGFLLLLLSHPPVIADQYIVNADGSGDFVTIQQAVDAATSGDEIIVAAGTYVADPRNGPVVHVHDKSLRIFSNAGPASTTIDGQGVRRCVLVTGNAAHVVRLEGFQVVHGEATWHAVDGDMAPDDRYGGGLLAVGNCHVVLNACWFFFNNSDGHGGGVSAWSCTMELAMCLFRNNTSTKGNGGGIRCDLSEVDLVNCIIDTNVARSGGGLFSYLSDLHVTTTSFGINTATTGAAAQVAAGSAVFSQCTFGSNSATDGGGVAWLEYGSSIVMDGCTLMNNSSGNIGGGLCLTTSTSATLENCLLESNSASDGGALHVEEADATLVNCTLLTNMAAVGGGLSFGTSSTGHIMTCDFQANAADDVGDAVNSVDSAETSIALSWFCPYDPGTITGPWIDEGNNILAKACDCAGDLDGDDTVDVSDLVLLLDAWGTAGVDIDGDGMTNVNDVLILLHRWGLCP